MMSALLQKKKGDLCVSLNKHGQETA